MAERLSGDPSVLSSAALSDALRLLLRARRRFEDGRVQAAALAYELAAVVALDAPSPHEADALLDEFAAIMKEQIRRLGIGVEHP